MRIRPNGGSTCDYGVGHQADAVFQHGISANAAKRADKNVFTKSGTVFDDRAGMNISHMAAPTP
jgi:hypothetical protein